MHYPHDELSEMRGAGARHELDRLSSFPPARSAPMAVDDASTELDAVAQLRVEKYAKRHPGADLTHARAAAAQGSAVRRESDIGVHHMAGLSRDSPPVAARPRSAVQLIPLKHDEFGEPSEEWCDIEWPSDDDDSAAGARKHGARQSSASAPRQRNASTDAQHAQAPIDEVGESHAHSRAFWTASERANGHPDHARSNESGVPALAPASTRAVASRRHAGVEVFSGILRMSRAAEPLGLRTVGVIERDPYDLEFAKKRFVGIATSANVLTAEYRMWRLSAEVMFVLACAPCRIVATPGRQLGLDDPDADVTVRSAADVANHFNAPFVTQENHANLATMHGGAVLLAIDDAQRAGGRQRTPYVADSPHGAELVLDTGVPELRHRIAMQHEDVRLENMISPCPRLHIDVPNVLRIVDILEDPAHVDPKLFVAGKLRLLPDQPVVCSRGAPTVAAVLTFGGPSEKVTVGSRVRRHSEKCLNLYVVTDVQHAPGTCTLFVDEGERRYNKYTDVPLADLLHVAHDINVYNICGVAGTVTDFGVPPVYEDKQLILVGDRARRFTTTELYRLGGDEAGLFELRRLRAHPRESVVRRRHGKSLSMSLAKAMTKRLRARIDEFIAVREGHLAPYSERPEPSLSTRCVTVDSAAAVVVFLALTTMGMLVLVDATSGTLPGLSRSGAEVTHKNVIERVAALTNAFECSLGYKPAALRAAYATPGDTASAHVVACPLGDAHERSDHPRLRWVAPSSIDASSDVRRVCELASAAVVSMQSEK